MAKMSRLTSENRRRLYRKYGLKSLGKVKTNYRWGKVSRSRSFRKALSESKYTDRVFVGCAFRCRERSLSNYGLFASVVVPEGLSPKAALRRRTLWLVKRSCLVVLFPEDPCMGGWGKGSKLVYRSALDQLKPVFVICSSPPKGSDHYRVIGSCLYEVEGFWVVPHPVSEGGLCDEVF